MKADATECYYYPWVTDTCNLQSCMNHAVESHGENIKSEICFVFLSKKLLALLMTGSKIGK